MQVIHYPFFEKPKAANGQPVIIALDCLLLSSHSVNIPKMSAKSANQAVIHVLEDDLLQDLEELAIFPNKETDGSWSAMVVEHKILSQIKDEISTIKMNCSALVPEFMLLPVLDNKISYLEKDQLVLFRISKFHGGKIDKTLFFELYSLEKLQASALGQHYSGFNLFKIGLWEIYGKQVKHFRLSATLAAFVFVLNLGGLLIENAQLSKQLEIKIAQNKALFLSIFTDITRITDLPVELDARLVKINKWQQLLNKDLLLAMSKQQFDNNTQRITFDNNQLQVFK